MPVAPIVAEHPAARRPGTVKEAIWVFESNQSGQHSGGAAAVAVSCHGAQRGQYSGAAGSSYVIPTRDAENALLPWSELSEHVNEFRQFAVSRPHQRFQIVPSPFGKTEEQHDRFAELFCTAPPNCELPGRWLERLERLRSARLILLDANRRILETEDRRNALDEYFTVNEALWAAEQIELVSFGRAQTLVHNDRYAKARGYRHRVIAVDPDYYGDYAAQAREYLAMAYATKVVCLNDPMATNTGNQIGMLHLAMSAGLPIDEITIP